MPEEGLLADAMICCDHVAQVRVVGPWMPVVYPAEADKLYLIHEGRGRLQIGASLYDLGPGQGFFIPAGTPHGGESDRDRPLRKTFVHFRTLTAAALPLLRLDPPPRALGGVTFEGLRLLGRRLEDEWAGQRPARGLLCKAILAEALALAYRAAATDLIPPLEQPPAPTPRTASDEQYDAIKTAVAYIEAHYDRPLDLPQIAAKLSWTPGHFSRVFSRLVGTPPRRFIEAIRIREARRLLASADTSIAEVAGRVGYDDPNYFSRAFQRVVGQPPTRYRQSLSPGASSA